MVWLLAREEIFLISKAFRLALGPTLFPIQQVLRVLSLQWLGCEADHWALSNVEVKNRVKLCPASQCAFTAQTGTNFFSFLTLPSLYFTLWMSMVNSSPGCWQVQTMKNLKLKMVWKQGDKSCFTFLKYNDGHDSTFHKTLLSQAFTDKLQDKQYRYEHNLLRTSDMMS